MPTCNFSGIRWTMPYISDSAHWPHPALGRKIQAVPEQPYLSMASALYALASDFGVVQSRAPLTPAHFQNAAEWLVLMQGLLAEQHRHLTGVGSARLTLYPVLVLDESTQARHIESWLNESLALAEEYQVLSTPARDAANLQHSKIVAAANRQPERESAGMRSYIQEIADRAGLEGFGLDQFFSAVRSPYGVSDKSINTALNVIHDFAPTGSIDEQLHHDTLVQRLSDSLLDSGAREQARIQNLNRALSRDSGLFNIPAPATPAQPAPQALPAPAQNTGALSRVAALQALLAQRRQS